MKENNNSYKKFVAGVISGVAVLTAFSTLTSCSKNSDRYDSIGNPLNRMGETIAEEVVPEKTATAIIIEDYTATLVDLRVRPNFIQFGYQYDNNENRGYEIVGDDNIVLFAKNGDEILVNAESVQVIYGENSHEKALMLVETQLGNTLVTEYNTGKKLELTQNWN